MTYYITTERRGKAFVSSEDAKRYLKEHADYLVASKHAETKQETILPLPDFLCICFFNENSSIMPYEYCGVGLKWEVVCEVREEDFLHRLNASILNEEWFTFNFTLIVTGHGENAKATIFVED